MEALRESSDPIVTLYYDEESSTEYIKLRGKVDYQKTPDEFFYFHIFESDRWAGQFRVKFQQGDSTDTSPPTTPTDLTVESRTGESVTLSWSASTDDVSGVAEYVVRVNGTERARSLDSDVTIHGLDAGTTHEVTVTAVDGTGKTSSPSAPVTVSVDASGNCVVEHFAGDDGEVTDVDLLEAIRYWRADQPVPGTCGETVDYQHLLELVERWKSG